MSRLEAEIRAALCFGSIDIVDDEARLDGVVAAVMGVLGECEFSLPALWRSRVLVVTDPERPSWTQTKEYRDAIEDRAAYFDEPLTPLEEPA